MKEQVSHQSVDPILLPILQTEDEVESQHLLENLVASYINPIIKEIIHHKLRLHTGGGSQQDGEDVQGNAVLRLLSFLREFKRDPASRNISNFRSYVAVTAYNACNEYLRQKYPQRHSLKNQLRYLFTHFSPLAMWSADDDHGVCGMIDWQSQKRLTAPHSEILNLLNKATSLGLDNQPLIDVVTTLLKLLGSPLALDDLVNLVAEAKGMRDEAAQTENEEGESLVERLPDGRAPVDTALEQRSHLERLWREIAELPLRQRIALLLNLKDEHGNSQLEMFPFTGVATIRQIAQAFFTGLTNGTSATTYSPSATVTREQMAAFITRTQDSTLKRGSRRAAAGQWWTPKDVVVLNTTVVGDSPQFNCFDGEDIWVANDNSGTVTRVHASDGRVLETWTGATGAYSAIAAAGFIYVTGNILGEEDPGKIFRINPSLASGDVTEVENNLGVDPVSITYDGLNLWTANLGAESGTGSITRYNIVTHTNTTFGLGFNQPAGIVFDGTHL